MHSKNDDNCLPLIAFSINPARNVKFTAFTLVHWLRERNWILPAYSLPANVNDITVARIVVRETLTRGMADMLIDDIRVTLIALAHHYGNTELIDELKAASDPHHVSHRSRTNRQRTRHAMDEGHHDHGEARSPRSSSAPHRSSAKDAKKVQDMRPQHQQDAKGVPTTHILC